MRVFFALPLGAEARDEAERWRRNNLMVQGRQVPASNFHITLCFLGSLNSVQLSGVTDAAGGLSAAAFEMTLDTPGYFPGPRVFWIGPHEVPGPLAELAAALAKIARRSGIALERRPFRPHLTLLRKCQESAMAPLRPPNVLLQCDRFSLMESRSGRNGVHYTPLGNWKLGTGGG